MLFFDRREWIFLFKVNNWEFEVEMVVVINLIMMKVVIKGVWFFKKVWFRNLVVFVFGYLVVLYIFINNVGSMIRMVKNFNFIVSLYKDLVFFMMISWVEICGCVKGSR